VTNYAVGDNDGEVLVGDTLYLGTAAIDLKTNQILWRGTPANTRTLSGGFVYDHGLIFMGLEDIDLGTNEMAALDAATGAVIWTTPDPSVINQTPVVVDGSVVYADHDGTTYALSEANGKQMWADTAVAGGNGEPPSVEHNVAYQVSGSHVTAINAATGKVKWTTPLISGQSDFDLAFADGLLYVGGDTVDAATGEVISASPGPSPVGLAVVKGVLYAAYANARGFAAFSVVR